MCIITAAIWIVAVLVSWYENESVLWAIVHGIFSGIYLIYKILIGDFSNGRFSQIMKSYF